MANPSIPEGETPDVVPDKPRYGNPGKTPDSAEGPNKKPGKVEGEEFSDAGVSREHPGRRYR